MKQVTARLPPKSEHAQVEFKSYTKLMDADFDMQHMNLKSYYPKVSKSKKRTIDHSDNEDLEDDLRRQSQEEFEKRQE